MVPLRRMVYLVLGSCVALGLGWCAEAEKVGGKGVTNEWHFLKRNLLSCLAIDTDGLTCDKFGLLHNPRLPDKEAVGVSAYHSTNP